MFDEKELAKGICGCLAFIILIFLVLGIVIGRFCSG